VAPFDLVRIADLGDAWIERPFELEGAHAEINAFFATVHAAGVTPLSVGGDHSISLPILRAIARNGPLGLVDVDAHCDTGDDYLGSRFHHGAPFRRAVEEGIIDPRQVGEGSHRARLRAGTGESSYCRHKIARCCLRRAAQPQELRGCDAVVRIREAAQLLTQVGIGGFAGQS
jgi:arginase family enzyme